MQNKNKAGISPQFSFRFGFQAQKKERKLEADGEAEGRRGRGLGSNVGRLEEESWRRSPAQHFHTKAPSGPAGCPSVRPPGHTDAALRRREISRGSSSDKTAGWGWGGGERRWTEERGSWWVPAESAHSGWELLQEGRASDWTPASVPLREADPFGHPAGRRPDGGDVGWTSPDADCGAAPVKMEGRRALTAEESGRKEGPR